MTMRRVLLCDDARLLAELEGTALGRSGLTLCRLAPGEDAVAISRQFQPDLIVLEEGDFCPDAFDTVRRLRADESLRSVPLIFIGLSLNRTRLLACGVDVFLPIPISRAELRHALERAAGLADRAALRRQVELEATLDVEPEPPQRVICLDLSASGALLDVAAPPAIGATARLSLRAGRQELQLPLQVVRHAGPTADGRTSIGVQFLGLDLAQCALLARFVRKAGERRHEQLQPAPREEG